VVETRDLIPRRAEDLVLDDPATLRATDDSTASSITTG
jgi:hypothetical protein